MTVRRFVSNRAGKPSPSEAKSPNLLSSPTLLFFAETWAPARPRW